MSDIRAWKHRYEDIEDIRVIEERRNEQMIPAEEMDQWLASKGYILTPPSEKVTIRVRSFTKGEPTILDSDCE